MEKVKVGVGRLYNAKACTILGGKEFSCRFILGNIEVLATIGPNMRHLVMALKIYPAYPKDKKPSEHITRERVYEYPSPDIFPSDVYLELVATQMIDVKDDLAKAYFDKDLKARNKILEIAKQGEPAFKKALDYVAGILGLRLHYLLVSIPIIEQLYAYRKKGDPYSLVSKHKITVTDSYNLDIKEFVRTAKERLPNLVRGWKVDKASEILAWLLRAWVTEDSALKFVSLFTALECVIPSLKEENNLNKLKKNRKKILSLVKEHVNGQEQRELIKLVSGFQISAPSLANRFEKWASIAELPGWESDILAFKRFSRMRNFLLHAGEEIFELKINITPNDVRTLEDLTERYVSLALFGDAKVYKSKRYYPNYPLRH